MQKFTTLKKRTKKQIEFRRQFWLAYREFKKREVEK